MADDPQARSEFVLEVIDLARARAASCRAALVVFQGHVARAEADLPYTQSDRWPAEVQAAAQRLQSVAKRRRRGNPAYGQTGVIPITDAETWAAFVTFAPWAFDASVWASDDQQLVSLSDEGTSIVLKLTTAEQLELQARVGAARLTPLSSRRRFRREPPRNESE